MCAGVLAVLRRSLASSSSPARRALLPAVEAAACRLERLPTLLSCAGAPPLLRALHPLTSLRSFASSAAPEPAAAEAAPDYEEPSPRDASAPTGVRVLGKRNPKAAARAAAAAAAAAESAVVRSFKVDATYIGNRMDIYSLMHRPEFKDHYRKLHKGCVVVALMPGHIEERAEAEVCAVSVSTASILCSTIWQRCFWRE
jgi:hypothetical protein